MSLPQKIKLEEADAKVLSDLDNKTKGLQSFVQTVMEQGERRGRELQEETGQFWLRARSKYNLDLDHVNYTLDNDGEHIIPITMKLV